MTDIKRFIKYLAIFCLFLSPAVIIPECEADENKQRIGWMPVSHHFFQAGLDEVHGGFFYEHQLQESVNYVGVMNYHNSVGNNSWALYGTNETYLWDGKLINHGLTFGVVTGYEIDPAPFITIISTVHLSEQVKFRSNFFAAGVAAQLYYEF